MYSYVVPEGGYAANGNLLTYWDSVMGNWNFTYDTLNRLTGSQNTGTTGVSTQLASVVGCWTYDGFGNRLLEAYSNTGTTPCANQSQANLQLMSTPQGTSYNNQLAGSYLYDGGGNVNADTRSSYLYDAEGRLCAVNNGASDMWQYVYDASGNRVAKGQLSAWPTYSGSGPYVCPAPTGSNFTLTTLYLLDQSGDQVTELAVNTAGAVTWSHSNAWEGGRLTGTYDNAGLHFAIADPLGTKRVQVNASGVPQTTASEVDMNRYSALATHCGTMAFLLLLMQQGSFRGNRNSWLACRLELPLGLLSIAQCTEINSVLKLL